MILVHFYVLKSTPSTSQVVRLYYRHIYGSSNTNVETLFEGFKIKTQLTVLWSDDSKK